MKLKYYDRIQVDIEIPEDRKVDKDAIEKSVLIDILSILSNQWAKIEMALDESTSEDGSTLHDKVWLTQENIVVNVRYILKKGEGAQNVVLRLYSNNTPVETLASELRGRIHRISALPANKLY